MVSKNFALLSIFGLWLSSAHGALVTLDETNVDFGERFQFARISHDFPIWNRSGETVTLKPGKLPKGTAVVVDDEQLMPGKVTTVHVQIDLGNRAGATGVHVPIDVSSATASEHEEIVFSGYVDSIFDVVKPAVDFGTVNNTTKTEKSLTFTSAEGHPFRITKVVEAPPYVSVHISQDGKTVLLESKKFDVLGYSKGIVKLAVDSAEQHEVWITVLMDIHGNVVPDQNPIKFGLQRPSQRLPVRLQLTSRDGTPFKVGKIDLPADEEIDLKPVPCLPQERPDCRAYVVGLDKAHKFGIIDGKIGFELPDTHQVLNIFLGGVYLSDQQQVRSLNEETGANAQTHESQAPRKLDLTSSISEAVKNDAEVDPPGEGSLLKWDVANEAGIYGYAIYRGDSEKGPFTRANVSVVRAKNQGDNITANYRWRDTTVEKGKEYWYYICIFYNNGHKQQLTGPQKVTAK